MKENMNLIVKKDDEKQYENIELENNDDLSEEDIARLNNEWKAFCKTLDNNKITQKTKDYLLEKGRESLENKKQILTLLANTAQDKINIAEDQKTIVELLSDKLQLIKQNFHLQEQLGEMQKNYDQKVEENCQLFRENHELRFPRAYGKLDDKATQTCFPKVKDNKSHQRSETQTCFPKVKDNKSHHRGEEFKKKLNNGRGEIYGIQYGDRTNRFCGK